MADEIDNIGIPEGHPEEQTQPSVEGGSKGSLRQLWQLPTLILGVLALGLGVYLAFPEPEENEYTEVMGEVQMLLDKGDLDSSQMILDEKLGPYIGAATDKEQAMYHMLLGDLIYQRQASEGWDKTENHIRTRDYYLKAAELGIELDGLHLQRLAETFVALNAEAQALGILDQIPDNSARRRYLVLRKIIERRRDARASPADLAPILTRFLEEVSDESDGRARRAQELWAVSLQAEGYMQAGSAEHAVQYVQRRMIGFMAEGGDSDLAPLKITLAKAFARLGEHSEAQRWYRAAQQQMPRADQRNADVLVGLARIALARDNDIRAALEFYGTAERDYPTSEVYIESLIGRADCEARMGAHAEAIDHFSQAVSRLSDDYRARRDMDTTLTQTVRSHYEMHAARENYDLALEYISTIRPLYQDKLPAEWLIEFAVTHERIAEQRVQEIRESQQSDMEQADGEEVEVDPHAPGFIEAAMHFGRAGDFFIEHANEVASIDDEAFGQSLWQGAVCYDQAKLWDKAIEFYGEFVKARPNDPRQLKARRHLAVAYQSNGQPKVAVDIFTRIIEEHRQSPEAYKSLVPLARCHITLEEFESAERVLLHVVDNHPALTPESGEYRNSLIELGKLYHREERFERAIERLSEADQRYGDTDQGPMIRFTLADSYRQSVRILDQELGESMPQSRRIELQAQRASHLELAQKLFNLAINDLSARKGSKATDVERLALRNSYFYRADCAYDLGRYEEAIGLYDLAAKRWESDPASLIALVQIVNAYCELGRTADAKVANDRARWQLKRIPDKAFDDSSLPMTRQHWQDWLRWTSELNLFGSPTGTELTGIQ